MMINKPQFVDVPPHVLPMLDCRGLLRSSILPDELAASSYEKVTGDSFSRHLLNVRRGFREWLFGDPPGIHQVLSIRDLDPEMIAQLDPRAKLLLAEQMFDLVDYVYAGRLKGMRKIEADGFNLRSLKEFDAQANSEQEYLIRLGNALMRPRQGYDFALMISSFGQSIAYSRNYIEGIYDAIARREKLAPDAIERFAKASMQKWIVYDGKGFEVSFARKELAGLFSSNLLLHSKDSRWDRKILEMHVPCDRNLLKPHWSHISWWPPSASDPRLRIFERILGWKFIVSPRAEDSVKIAIDFGDSYYEEPQERDSLLRSE